MTYQDDNFEESTSVETIRVHEDHTPLGDEQNMTDHDATAAPVPAPEEDGTKPAESAPTEEAPAAVGEPGEKDGEPATPDETIADGKTVPKGVQKRFDQLTKDREDARRERDEMKAQLAEAKQLLTEIKGAKPGADGEPAATTDGAKPEPKEEDFDDYAAYVDALADWKADQKYQARVKQDQEAADKKDREEFAATVEAKWDEGRAKYNDFDKVALEVQVTDVVSELVVSSEHCVDMAYYLGQHPDDVTRLNKLSALDPTGPLLAAKEFGRLEDKVTEKPQTAEPVKPRPTVKAPPAPQQPVGTGSTAIPDLETMPYSKYKELRLKQMGLR